MCLAPPCVALVIPADTRAITFARDDMSMTLGWYRDGGPVMLLILLVAIAGIVVLFERTYVIVMRSSNSGRAFIERIIQLVRVGKIDDAIKQCTASTAVLPDMGLLILRSRSRDETDLQNVADAAALAVLPKLTRRLHYLSTLAVTAGLLGLFGALFEIHDMLMTAGADSADPRTHGPRLGCRVFADDVRRWRCHRAPAGARVPGQPGRGDHGAGARVLRAADQCADRPAGRSAWASMNCVGRGTWDVGTLGDEY